MLLWWICRMTYSNLSIIHGNRKDKRCRLTSLSKKLTFGTSGGLGIHYSKRTCAAQSKRNIAPALRKDYNSMSSRRYDLVEPNQTIRLLETDAGWAIDKTGGEWIHFEHGPLNDAGCALCRHNHSTGWMLFNLQVYLTLCDGCAHVGGPGIV